MSNVYQSSHHSSKNKSFSIFHPFLSKRSKIKKDSVKRRERKRKEKKELVFYTNIIQNLIFGRVCKFFVFPKTENREAYFFSGEKK